jgi:hypothetical protein
MGLNPAWRASIALVVAVVIWPDGSSVSEIEAARDRLRRFIEKMSDIAPDAGTYFGEVSSNWCHPSLLHHTSLLQVVIV